MYRRFPTAASASWASPSYQRLVFGHGRMADLIDEHQSTFEEDAFLAAKEKKKANTSQENMPFNKLHKCPLLSYPEWTKAKTAVRDKNKNKKEARKRKEKTVINF